MNRMPWPWSMEVLERMRVGVDGGVYEEVMVIVSDFKEFNVTGVDAESVTATFASIVFPASAVGIVQENVFPV